MDGDGELAAAAGLHDIGRARVVRAAHPGVPHEVAAERFCDALLGDRVSYLVGQHVPAKRFLVAVDPTYHAALSTVSVATLRQQGGPMDVNEVAAFASPGTPMRPRCADGRRGEGAGRRRASRTGPCGGDRAGSLVARLTDPDQTAAVDKVRRVTDLGLMIGTPCA